MNKSLETYRTIEKPDIGVGVSVVVVLVLVLAGLWLRTTGLAERPLSEDEYYFVGKVQNILESGTPRYSDGGYNVRGILLQYLAAVTVSLVGSDLFGYRLPFALFSAATLVVAYFLRRRFMNREWCVVLVSMLAFSSWEIEFARFIRMYSGFQFFAVCF